MNAEFREPEVVLAGLLLDAIAADWRSRILAGYLPYWRWRCWRVEWGPSMALRDAMGGAV